LVHESSFHRLIDLEAEDELQLPWWICHVSFTRSLSRLVPEDHVWFEDRWMVASLCDDWLTTLCGLILG
jgi:hypothetical protein